MKLNLLAAATLSAALYAAPINIYNTGVDSSNTLLTSPAADPHWSLLSGPLGAGSAYVAGDSTFPVGAPWLPNQAAAKWITPTNSATDSIPAGDYIYRTSFDLTGLLANTGSFTGSFAVDNTLVDIRLNGVSLGITGGNFSTLTALSFACGVNCVAGINTLDFVVNNTAPNPSPVGLLVNISGSADAAGPGPGPATPEPSSYLMMATGAGLFSLARFRRKK